MAEKTEKQRIISALSNATIVMIIITILGLFTSQAFFGNTVSIIGFALFAVLFYAVR